MIRVPSSCPGTNELCSGFWMLYSKTKICCCLSGILKLKQEMRKELSECTVNVHWKIDTRTGLSTENMFREGTFHVSDIDVYERKQHFLTYSLFIRTMLVYACQFKACSFSLPMSWTLVVLCSCIPLSTSNTVVEGSSCNFQVLEEYSTEHHPRYPYQFFS